MLSGKKFWQIMAGFNGFMAIIMGALAAHAIADSHLAAMADKASLYQLIHAAILLYLSAQQGKFFSLCRLLFLAGIILFCGTLYTKALLGWNAATQLAPFGGISFMLGWIMIAVEKQNISKE